MILNEFSLLSQNGFAGRDILADNFSQSIVQEELRKLGGWTCHPKGWTEKEVH